MFLKLKAHQAIWFGSSFFITYFIVALVGLSSNYVLNFFAISIIFLSLVGLMLQGDKPFTLAKMVYIYYLFFFGVVPLNDVINSNAYYGGALVDESYQTYTIAILFLSLVIFLGFNFLSGIYFDLKFRIISKESNCFSKEEVFKKRLKNLPFVFLFIIYFLVGYFIFKISDFNLLKVLFRGIVINSDVVNTNRQLDMFNNYVLKPLPIVIFLFLHWRLKYFSLNFFQKALMLFFFLVSIFLVFPTSVPRFLAAALYIPFFLSFSSLWKIPYFMVSVIFVSLLIVFPFLNNFRRFDEGYSIFYYSFDFMNHGHFDGFQNFSRVVELDIITYGYQLLGSLFFFIPRTFWFDKPVGSGSLVASEANLIFDNIAMPYIAEGYINFGLWGVILFSVAMAFSLSYFDSRYSSTYGKNNSGFVFYCLSYGLIFFLMRGDLLSGTAFFAGLYFSFLFSRFIINKLFP